MFKRTGLDKSEKNRVGVPNPKKFERLDKNKFVVHADGGNYFEGVVKNPNVRIKESGRITMTTPNICLKKCINKDIKCNVCWKFSYYVAEENT